MTKLRDNPKLTTRHKIVANEYFKDFNQAQAMIRAGYSKNSAKELGYKLFSKPFFQQYLGEIAKKILDKVESDQDKLVSELRTLSFSKITDYLEYDESGTITFKATDNIPLDKIGAIQSVKSTDTKEGKNFEFKLHDKNKALDTLAKVLKLYNEAPKVEANQTIIISNYYGKEEE